MKRGEKDSHGNHERWLVSYADFITLLFAFFVVMFASTQTDRQRVQQSVRDAFEGAPKVSQVLGGTVDDIGQGNRMMRGPGGSQIDTGLPIEDNPELQPSLALLQTELSEQIREGKLSVHMEARGLVVSMNEASYFVSGDDGVAPAADAVLQQIASVILKIKNPVRLEGHTDSIPISNSRFRGNWELSTARGIAVLRTLESRFNVPTSRMSVAGYADTFPLDTNETAEGRARNRRVDVVILGRNGSSVLPETGPSATDAGEPPRR